jgi:hypothetical protein
MNDSTKPWIFDVPLSKTLIVLLCVVYSIAPPYIIIYKTDVELFKSLDFLKLLTLSTAFGLMIFSINYLWFLYLFNGFRLLTIYIVSKKKPDCKIKVRKKIFGFKSQELVAIFVLGFYTIFSLCFLIFDFDNFQLKNIKDRVFSSEIFYLITSFLLIAYYALIGSNIFLKISEPETSSLRDGEIVL